MEAFFVPIKIEATILLLLLSIISPKCGAATVRLLETFDFFSSIHLSVYY